MWCIWVFEEFWVTQNLGQSMLVTTPYCQWLLPMTNYGDQFQQWTLFILKQYCLEGILAKESSPRTKDFLLWRDLHVIRTCQQNFINGQCECLENLWALYWKSIIWNLKRWREHFPLCEEESISHYLNSSRSIGNFRNWRHYHGAPTSWQNF